jgi:CheY-like chemotaxis protein
MLKGFTLYADAFFTSERKYLSHPGGGSPVVLLVEDSDDSRRVLSLELRHSGCRVLTASDGLEAVETALSMRSDLILMDLNLPRLDGLAAAERIRARGDLSEVPIIALTAHDTYGIKEGAFEAGCQCYLLKPLKPDELERALREALPGFVFDEGEAADSSHENE